MPPPDVDYAPARLGDVTRGGVHIALPVATDSRRIALMVRQKLAKQVNVHLTPVLTHELCEAAEASVGIG